MISKAGEVGEIFLVKLACCQRVGTSGGLDADPLHIMPFSQNLMRAQTAVQSVAGYKNYFIFLP